VTRSVLHRVVDNVSDRLKIGMFREHLQKAVLSSLFRSSDTPQISFLGGTCLRIAHGIGRFSEDLDFSVYDDQFDFSKCLSSVKRNLERDGYQPRIKVRRSGTAAEKAEIQFPGLLYETGLSPLKEQNFKIKFEVDTNPPAHSRSERVEAHREVEEKRKLLLWCYDKPSLLAGKLAAIFCRPWEKGRDFFDLSWFLKNGTAVEPNIAMLDSALAQAEWDGAQITPGNWRDEVQKKISTLDFEKINADIVMYQISEIETPITETAIVEMIRRMEH